MKKTAKELCKIAYNHKDDRFHYIIDDIENTLLAVAEKGATSAIVAYAISDNELVDKILKELRANGYKAKARIVSDNREGDYAHFDISWDFSKPRRVTSVYDR